MLRSFENHIRMFAFAMLMAGATIPAAQAEKEHQSTKSTISNPKWKNECGACHVAYPPYMLPADSWRAIMSGLDKHFGINAGMDVETAKEITAFLVKHADTGKHHASGKPQLRITGSGWFKSKHRKIPARSWELAKVKSPANCVACHTKAQQGDFSEHSINMPK